MSPPRAPTSPGKGEVGRAAAGRGSSGLTPGNGATRFARTSMMTKTARRLRGALTDVETKLWHALRRHQIAGQPFRRQHPIGPYVVDFYCPPIKLAIELDGGQHGHAGQSSKDLRRTRWLEAHGIETVRYWNSDVTENFDGVLEDIVRVVTELRAVTPSPPLPLSGGGSGEAVPATQSTQAPNQRQEPATSQKSEILLGDSPDPPRAPTSPGKGDVGRAAAGRGSSGIDEVMP